MDNIRSILVHLDAGRHMAARLAFARTLAAQHEARLRALFAVTPRFVPVPLPLDAGGVPGAPLLGEVDPAQRRLAKAHFERTASGAGWPVEWDELADEPPAHGFARHALISDLLILGQHDPDDEQAFDVSRDFIASVLLACGKPAIVVPSRERAAFERAGCVLVAWQPTRESARALDAAQPLLQRAHEVHVVHWAEGTPPSGAAPQDVVEHLSLHGVEPVQCHQGPPPSDAGRALLELADAVGADVLVMGCYGHSRARELVLGGATRTVLRDMRLPVLMAH
jgi:nucleotide-binding universal stress UspA family protein